MFSLTRSVRSFAAATGFVREHWSLLPPRRLYSRMISGPELHDVAVVLADGEGLPPALQADDLDPLQRRLLDDAGDRGIEPRRVPPPVKTPILIAMLFGTIPSRCPG